MLHTWKWIWSDLSWLIQNSLTRYHIDQVIWNCKKKKKNSLTKCAMPPRCMICDCNVLSAWKLKLLLFFVQHQKWHTCTAWNSTWCQLHVTINFQLKICKEECLQSGGRTFCWGDQRTIIIELFGLLSSHIFYYNNLNICELCPISY